jgi:hypothetical protein
MDLATFAAPPGSRIMPQEDFEAMFRSANVEWRNFQGNRISYRLPSETVWREGGLRSHFRVAPDGGYCGKYESTWRALAFCLMLDAA